MDFLTIEDVSRKLNITEDDISDMISDGILKAYKLGEHYRILAESYNAYISANSQDYNAENESETDSSKNEATNENSSDQYIICGMDPVLDSIWARLSERSYDRPLARSYICSYQSLNALYFKEVMAGAAHLYDIDHEAYNGNFVKYLLPGTKCALIHLTCRVQGFYVKKGNPKNITSWDDLKRPDVRFLNREPGAGVRVLIDVRLCEHDINPSDVAGYDDIASSHLAAASAVARGDCDVSLGAQRTASQINGIEFIPLQKERYELVIRQSSLEDPQIKDILEILQSGIIKDEISEIDGYYPDEMGKVVLVP